MQCRVALGMQPGSPLHAVGFHPVRADFSHRRERKRYQ